MLPETLAAPILVVDDTLLNHEILGHMLRTAGWHNLHFAENGAEALKLLPEVEPALILLDLSMPVMDGFEFCEALRQLPAYQLTPVLVQTALTGNEERKLAFKAGATDFINKPVLYEELVARAQIHIENILLLKRLDAYHKRISAELDIARQMQIEAVPSSQYIAAQIEGLPISLKGAFDPASELGGDFWGVRRLNATQLGVYVADFAGHGVAAAINTFRLHTLIASMTEDLLLDPAIFLQQLSLELSQTLAAGQYLAMFYCVYDAAQQTLTYASAAMPDQIIFNDASSHNLLSGRGLPIGLSAQATYKNHTLDFKTGTTLFLFSDALTETSKKSGGFLTQADLAASLQAHTGNASQLVQQALNFFQTTCTPQTDDLTLVCLRAN